MKTKSIASLSAAALSIFMAAPSTADIACGTAPSQLQQYISQVNQVANWWFYQGIPQRCGYNTYCQNSLLQQLNFWYQQQAAQVNQWYYQIEATCTNDAQPEKHRFRRPTPGDNKIDESATDDLNVDENEDKTVTIVIPDNPSGFHGN